MAKLKHISTKKIIEILDDPYNRTAIGTDYGPYKEELEQILYKRQQQKMENDLKKFEAEQIEYQKYLDAIKGA